MNARLSPLVALAISIPAFPWLAEIVRTMPLEVLAAALLSTTAPVIAAYLTTRRNPPAAVCAAVAFGWGAVPAVFLARTANDSLLSALTPAIGEAASRWWTGAVLAPVVEESLKLASFAFVAAHWCMSVRDARNGAALAGLAAAGFAMTENTTYFLLAAIQGGDDGLLRSFWLRAVVGGMNHAAFSAAGGCLIGLALATPGVTRRHTLIAGGLLAATAFHLLWNVAAAPWMSSLLCGMPADAQHCLLSPPPFALFAAAPALTFAAIGPAVAFTALVIRRAGPATAV